jgi:acid stress-induced BolA-like protein IbaG/YrbA
MLTASDLRTLIANGLPCRYVKVLGDDGQHFEAVIVSPLFTGKSKVQQHQLVYWALGDRMRSEIHALSMKTFAPDAWAGSSTQ